MPSKPRSDPKQDPKQVAREPRDEESIIITRRQVVAEVMRDEDSEHPMLRTAFMAASDAIADGGGEHDRLEFTYGGGRFTIKVEPDKPEGTPNINFLGDSELVEALRERGWVAYKDHDVS